MQCLQRRKEAENEGGLVGLWQFLPWDRTLPSIILIDHMALMQRVPFAVAYEDVPNGARLTLTPMEHYLRGQGRFRHLLEPVLQESVIQGMQDAVDRYWEEVTI